MLQDCRAPRSRSGRFGLRAFAAGLMPVALAAAGLLAAGLLTAAAPVPPLSAPAMETPWRVVQDADDKHALAREAAGGQVVTSRRKAVEARAGGSADPAAPALAPASPDPRPVARQSISAVAGTRRGALRVYDPQGPPGRA